MESVINYSIFRLLLNSVENGNIGDSFSTEILAPNKTDEVLLKTASNIDRETVPIYHLQVDINYLHIRLNSV